MLFPWLFAISNHVSEGPVAFAGEAHIEGMMFKDVLVSSLSLIFASNFLGISSVFYFYLG